MEITRAANNANALFRSSLSFLFFSLLFFVLARDSTLKRRGGEGMVFESRFEREDPLDIIGVIVSNGRRKNVWKNVWVEEG